MRQSDGHTGRRPCNRRAWQLLQLPGKRHGVSSGRSAAQIFVTKEQDVEGTQQFTIPSFSQIEYEEYHGLLCTTVNRTIVDLLERDGDEQIIMESLANYYEEHGESFDGLRIPGHLRERFEKYSNWAKEYYEE